MPAYALTIFLGAFLLFQVQPLIGKYILPWFGGTPAVWTTCMLFFQALLLAGYGYAHLISNWRPRNQAILHVGMLLAAIFFLPIIPSESWKPEPGGNPTGHILLLLSVCLGVPYLVLAATSPLLQRWFSLSHPGVSPYRLYALSNAGSLLALVSYPFLIEPMLSRKAQATAWSAGMLLFAFACGCCAVLVSNRKDATREAAAAAEDAAAMAEPTLRRRLPWLGLPATASVLLIAATNKMCQDVAVIPFLWVLPLSLYLLTFIICFDSPRWYSRLWFSLFFLAGLIGVCVVLIIGTNVPLFWQIAAHSSALFGGCMVCHGELARLKPHPRHLTGFYLMIAAGGALGGLFVAVLAPLLFSDYMEYQASLLAAVFFAYLVFFLDRNGRLYRGRPKWAWACMGFLFGGLATALFWEVKENRKDAMDFRRNFYGVLIVYEYDKENPDGHARLLQHGRITHGLQLISPSFSRWPTTYYGENSGVGLAMRHFPRQENRRIGVVGLGVGTLAAYGKPGDYFRLYEINPLVKEIAETSFTYLSESQASYEVVMGDARLSMEREAPQEFDVLVLDAFSSDAIPVHLLTRESFETYLRHLKPDGVIAVHVSNHHLDLKPVVYSLADHFQLQTALIDTYENDEDTYWLYSSTWILLTNNREFLAKDEIASAASEPETSRRPIRLWTDDYSALFQVLD